MAQTHGGQTPGQTTSDTGNQTTVQGCLSGSSGSYTLTDSSGNSYQLTGNTSKLAKHVGHQIEVTGATSSAPSSAGGNETGAGNGGASAQQQQTLNVSSIKHLAASCNSGR